MRRLQRAMQQVDEVVGRHFPEALATVKVTLAVVAVGSLRGNTQPTTLILVGKSGSGKTLALSFLLPDPGDDLLMQYIERSDEFSPASFVTQASRDQAGKKLEEIDLLPRIKDKTLVTKELAPMFRGKQTDLVPRFNKLTGILDGMGYVSDSGTHGRRGYAEPINFQWLGATTPLHPAVLAVMETLGPRIVFYDADRPYKDDDALVDLVMIDEDTESAAIAECRSVVRGVILALHKACEHKEFADAKIDMTREQALVLVLCAKALVRLRASLPSSATGAETESREEFLKAQADEAESEADADGGQGGRTTSDAIGEQPERVMRLLRRIALGSARAHGRTSLTDYDLAQLVHIALSSGDAARGGVLRVVLEHGGSATTPQVQQALRVSAPTARTYMKQLDQCGIGRFVEGDEGTPHRVELAPAFTELRAAPLLKGLGGEGASSC